MQWAKASAISELILPRIWRLAVGLALILVAIGFPRSPALADDTSGLMGRWLVPSGEQKKSRMSPQCQQYAETDVQTVPESEIEIFSCDDPVFAPEKTRILEFVKTVNEVYRAENRPPYFETISGLCVGRSRDDGETEDGSLQSERKATRGSNRKSAGRLEYPRIWERRMAVCG